MWQPTLGLGCGMGLLSVIPLGMSLDTNLGVHACGSQPILDMSHTVVRALQKHPSSFLKPVKPRLRRLDVAELRFSSVCLW